MSSCPQARRRPPRPPVPCPTRAPPPAAAAPTASAPG